MGGRKVYIDSLSATGLIPLELNDQHTLSIASEDEFVGASGRMLHKIQESDEKANELILVAVAFALADKQI